MDCPSWPSLAAGGRYKFNETRKSVGYVGKVGARPFGGPVRVFFWGEGVGVNTRRKASDTFFLTISELISNRALKPRIAIPIS